jgi:hypothetical protein
MFLCLACGKNQKVVLHKNLCRSCLYISEKSEWRFFDPLIALFRFGIGIMATIAASGATGLAERPVNG